MMALCAEGNDAFYYVDHTVNNTTYRVFSYRLASYSDFLKPNALNCRGVMFRLVGNGGQLVSLPMEKFFNLNENPFTQNVDFEVDSWIAFEKLDGSLISSFIDTDGNINIKSKTSIKSEHVELAKQLLNTNKYVPLKDYIKRHEEEGRTVNMELCSNIPKFRIVVPYQETFLRVLNVRDRLSGEISFDYALPKEFLLEPLPVKVTNDYVQSVKDMVDFEGIIVFNEKTGQFIKVKTDWYLHRHHFKFNMTNVYNVIEMILGESIDDIKTLFVDDEAMMKYITNIESTVIAYYNKAMGDLTRFYEENRHLERKDYAIAAQKGAPILMSQKMNLYLNRKLSLKESIVKHAKELFPELFKQNEAIEE